MFDDVPFNIDNLIAGGLFPNVAPYVGHVWCWGASDGSDFATDDALACAIRSENVDGTSTTDIYLRASKFEGDLLAIPGGDMDVARTDVQFNRCADATAIAYPVLVHEVGHALGIRSGDVGSGHDESHPPIPGTVMYESLNAKEPEAYRCSLTPFGALALYAIYQSR